LMTLSISIIAVSITLASILLPPNNKPSVLGVSEDLSKIELKDDSYALEIVTLKGQVADYSLPEVFQTGYFDKVEIASPAKAGEIELSGSQRLVYKPNGDYTGSDLAELTLCNQNRCSLYTISILVQPLTPLRGLQTFVMDGKWNLASLVSFSLLSLVSGFFLYFTKPKKLRITYRKYPEF
jgi:hypothetical protein